MVCVAHPPDPAHPNSISLFPAVLPLVQQSSASLALSAAKTIGSPIKKLFATTAS